MSFKLIDPRENQADDPYERLSDDEFEIQRGMCIFFIFAKRSPNKTRNTNKKPDWDCCNSEK